MTGQPPIRFPDLHRMARDMGVHLTRHDGGPKGLYDHQTRTISTRRGMSATQYRSTLAHELGHAHYGDEPTAAPFDARQEKRADQYAANLLIDYDAFVAEYQWHNGHLGGVAEELEVTMHLLGVWIDSNWDRLRTVTNSELDSVEQEGAA